MEIMILLSILILIPCYFTLCMLKFFREGMQMSGDFELGFTPTRLVAAYRLVRSPIGVTTRQVHRKCWGIALKAGGKTYYTQNDQQYISDKTHVLLLPKGGCYSWTCTEPGECIIIDFDAPENGDVLRCVELTDNSTVLSAFLKIEKCLSIATPVSRLEAMQQLYGLLAYFARISARKYAPTDKRHILTPAMDHMMENYADPSVGNDALAALCGISTVYFRKTFEAVFGISPIRYLHDLRIGKAKAILAGDYDSIAQVAESVGYSSVYHFSKMFKTYTGMSPSQYAKETKISVTQ